MMETRWNILAAIMALGLVLWPTPAQAMHLSEGILPIEWAGLWFLVAAPFVYGGLWTIKRRRAEDPRAMTLVAMVGAAIFVISCMPVPIPWIGTCSHPCGTGLGALLIGPGPTVVVASIALLLQALLLAHGGLTTLGANIVSMGVVGAFGAYGVFHGLPDGSACRCLPRHLWPACSPTGPPTPRPPWNYRRALHGDGSLWGMFLAVHGGLHAHAASLGHCRGRGDGYRLPFCLGSPARNCSARVRRLAVDAEETDA